MRVPSDDKAVRPATAGDCESQPLQFVGVLRRRVPVREDQRAELVAAVTAKSVRHLLPHSELVAHASDVVPIAERANASVDSPGIGAPDVVVVIPKCPVTLAFPGEDGANATEEYSSRLILIF